MLAYICDGEGSDMKSIDHQSIQNAAEDIELITRSSNRIHLLAEFYQHRQLSRDHLRETDNMCRTTLQRNLNVLEEEGWIENSGIRYQITPCGELVAEEVLDLVRTTCIANQLQDVFQWISLSELDIDLRLLTDADIWTPEMGDPYAMVNRHIQLLRNAEHYCGLLRVTGLHAHEAGHDAVVHHGAQGELVVTPEIADIHTTKPQYAALTEELFETGRFELFVSEDDLPYSLLIIDETVQIGVDKAGEPQALLESTSDDVLEWANQVYADHKQQAASVM